MDAKPTSPADLYYDPYDPTIDRDPYPVWKRLRDEAPLYYNEKYDFYALSRFDDVFEALRDWESYSSALGTVLEIIRGCEASQQKMYGDQNLGLMIFSDPPGHDAARSIVAQHFTPKSVARFEARARSLCEQLFDKVAGRSEFDLVDEIIRPIPPMMIGEILGVPEEDQEQLGRLVDQSLSFDPESGPETSEAGVLRSEKESHIQIGEYINALVTKRKNAPQDDLISHIINSKLKMTDGSERSLEAHEVNSFFMLLQGAGSETTARALGWAGVLLARFPQQRQKLVDSPQLIRNAAEEVLRYEAPSPIQARYVTRDVEWHGYRVPKGAKIALLNGAAGRDERKYEDPENFDVERDIPRHLTFGYGSHICLGSSLARMEMRVVLEELLKRYPAWSVDESQVKLVSTTTVRGPARVPICVN